MGKVYSIKSRKSKKRFKLRHLLASIFVLYIVCILVSQQIAIKEASRKEEDIKSRIEQLKEENESIKTELERTKDEEYIEKLAREKLGMIKPGEIMFIDVNYKMQNMDN